MSCKDSRERSQEIGKRRKKSLEVSSERSLIRVKENQKGTKAKEKRGIQGS